MASFTRILQALALRTHRAGLVTVGWAVCDGKKSRRVPRLALMSFALGRDLPSV